MTSSKTLGKNYVLSKRSGDSTTCDSQPFRRLIGFKKYE